MGVYKKQPFLKEKTKKICIVGIGSLGTNTAEMIVRKGVKELILIDRDFVDSSNIDRQSLFNKGDIGRMKVDVAKEYLEKINNELIISSYKTDIDYDNIDLLKSDLILDCTDNMYTRFLINEYCIKNKIPWIYSSALENSGYVKVFNNSGACFSCLFSEPTGSLGTCDTEGLSLMIARMISSIQVEEAVKIMNGEKYTKELIYVSYDKINRIETKKKENCDSCWDKFNYLNGKKASLFVKLCGTDKYLIRTKKYNLDELETKLKNLGVVKKTDNCLFFNDITIFNDGKVMLKAKDESNAKSIIVRYLE